MVFRAMVNGANDQTVISYDQEAFPYWRIRRDATTNTVHVETSSNGGRYRLNSPDGTYSMGHTAQSAPTPDWLQVDFNGLKTIDEIDVVTTQDNVSSPAIPTEVMTFTTYGITAFEVQYWNGSGCFMSGNNLSRCQPRGQRCRKPL